jgi:hypothetical protein
MCLKDLKLFQTAENGIKSDDTIHLSGFKMLTKQKWTALYKYIDLFTSVKSTTESKIVTEFSLKDFNIYSYFF